MRADGRQKLRNYVNLTKVENMKKQCLYSLKNKQVDLIQKKSEGAGTNISTLFERLSHESTQGIH